MPQGLLLNMGLMAGAVGFALLIGVAPAMALATAGGLVLCAGATRHLDHLPRFGLYAIAALVPLNYLGSALTVGAVNSLTKLAFLPAFAVLLLDWVLARRRPVLGRQGLFVALLGLTLGLSYLLNASTPDSLRVLFRFASMGLLFLLCANALRDERDLALLLAVMVGATVLSAAGSVLLPVLAAPNSTMDNGTVTRMTGWSTYDAPMFGTDLLVSLLIAVYFALVTRSPGLRLLLALTASGLLVAIASTYARGVSLVTIVSLGYLFFRLRKRVSPLTVVVVVLLLVVVVAPLIPPLFWDRIVSAFTDYGTDPTMGRRAATYRIGLQLFGQSPLLGFGPGNFITQYMAPEFRFDRSGVPSVCFNLYLSIATQAGILGLAALALLIGTTLRELRFVGRSFGADDAFLKQAAEVLEIVLVAVLLVSLFEPTDLQKCLWLILGAAAAAARLRKLQLAAAAAPAREPA